MAGHNISVYLDDQSLWERFKKACRKEGKRPNTVLRSFIVHYSDNILKREPPLEYQIARSMIEARKIARGELTGKKARDLLNEL
ncbi:hypothetical protein ACFL27_09395 [candidate division CSSED10-310 bacterium]|uniref:CopG family transcriptional regulator n=1 Tax=candidate division CSSED10-310 bacterium TaxID=2855610 RepID=A0ABV6YW14_UNCC1